MHIKHVKKKTGFEIICDYCREPFFLSVIIKRYVLLLVVTGAAEVWNKEIVTGVVKTTIQRIKTKIIALKSVEIPLI